MKHFPNYFVDGYNLLHQIGAGKQLNRGVGNLSRARFQMLQSIAKHFTVKQQRQVTVVFDAEQKLEHVDPDAERVNHDINVIYASEHESADDYLIDVIQKFQFPKRLVVVTGDRRIQVAAKRRGVQYVEPLEWFEALTELANHVEQESSTVPDPVEALRESPIDKSERDFWLREFGIEDESE
ncbi:MAG: NYN domain-containing protein [Pirellulaceae bacterium]